MGAERREILYLTVKANNDIVKSMKKIKINLNKTTKEQIDLIVRYLKQGKVVVLLTDTIYGLHCLATDKKAIDRVYKTKKRSRKKPLIILVSSISMLKKYCYVNKKQTEFLKIARKRPTTVVLKCKQSLPNELTAGSASVAVRLPKNNFLIKIIRKVKKPIVSTSLNIEGKRSLTTLNNLDKYFKKSQPDLVIDTGKTKKAKPSRLIDIRDIKNIKVLRK